MLATEAFKEGDNDKLPVVELRPFVKKEWRPSKSLPDSDLERRGLSALRSAISSRSLDFESVGYPNPEKQMTITPLVHEAPYSKAFLGQGERRTQHPPLRDSKDTYVEYDTWRGRERFMEHPEGFVSKLEREKSTVEEVRIGSSVCTQYSCLKRAMTEVDLRNQQTIRVNGKKIDNLPPRVSSMYGDIHEYYRLTKSYNTAPTENQQPGQENKIQNNDVLNDIRVRMDGIQTTYLDDSIYDSFDRSSTLPSIRVKKASLKKKQIQRYPESSASSRRSSGRRGCPPGYRLGVTNSLHLMSHIGKPINVEQILSHELRLTIGSLRRSKDNASIISGAYKIIPKYETAPTAGEYRTNSGLQPNISRVGQDSRHNTQSNPNQYTSGTSTYLRSEIMDSGMTSNGGCCSPIKPMSRNASSRLNSKDYVGKEILIHGNKSTDTKGRATSDTGKAGDQPKDIHSPLDRGPSVDTPSETRDKESRNSTRTRPIASIPTDSISMNEEPQQLNLTEDSKYDNDSSYKGTTKADTEKPEATLSSASSSSVNSEHDVMQGDTPQNTQRSELPDAHVHTDKNNDGGKENGNVEIAECRNDQRTFVTQQPSAEDFAEVKAEESSPMMNATHNETSGSKGCVDDVNVTPGEVDLDVKCEENDVDSDGPEASTLIPKYTVE